MIFVFCEAHCQHFTWPSAGHVYLVYGIYFIYLKSTTEGPDGRLYYIGGTKIYK